MVHTVVRVGANVVCTAIDIRTPLCILGVLQSDCARFSYSSVVSGFWIVGEITNE